MLKGLLLGSASALTLSALFVTAVALVVPAPEPGNRPVAALPDAPVLRDQAESAPRVPDRPVDIVRAASTPTPAGAAPVSAVDLPAASQFNRPREDGTVFTPGIDAVARPVAVAEGLRRDEAPVAEPAPDTRSAAAPQPSVISGFGAAPETGDAPAVPRSLFDAAPQTFGLVETGEDPEALPPADAPATDVAQAAPPEPTPVPVPAEDIALTETPEQPAASAETVTPDAVARTQSNGPEAAPVQTAQITEVEEPVAVPHAAQEDPAPVAEPVLPRRLVLDSEREDDADAPDETVETTATAGASATPNALVDFAAAFTNPEGLPLMSVVLIDDPDSDVDRDSLVAFDFPVTFAIDPTRPDAGEAAAAYRAAGHEVVALATIFPPGATAQDIEVAMSSMRRTLPEAVAVLDRAGGGIVGNRARLDALLPSLAEAGMGLLAYPSGLNSGVTTAQREGVAAATLYRVIDEADDSAPVMVRFLDRATFEAAQDGATVVLGRTDSETVAALYSWRLGNRAEQVAAAPLSAVLRNTIGN